jgi:adenine-specific DNA-methyltransferase
MQDTELPEKITPQSPSFKTELAQKIAEIAPEVVSDGKLDVTKLRELVNGDAENSPPEKFGLFWPGKRAAQALAQIPTTATLVPAPDESVDWDTTKNIFIEGDNLEVLKALQNSYRRKVKMIYIDPPYNTGKEFIYPDKFSEGLQGYLEYTGQKNEAGENVESKPETGGRRHSNWLSMMYPRLQLAKSLLSDDGVVFVSIDDNEQANLNALMNEIFGEDNFVAELPTVMNLKGNNDQFAFAGTHEYTVVYAKNIQKFTPNHFLLDDEDQEAWLTDDKGYYKKGANLKATGGNAPRSKRPNLFFPIYINDDLKVSLEPAENYQEVLPITDGAEMSWRWSRDKFTSNLDELIISKTGEGFSISKKQRPAIGDLPTSKPKSLFYKPEYSSGNGTSAIKSLFDGNKYFENPKPLQLLIDFIQIGTSDDDLILDIFSGSGTTAHAVMKMNAEDGGSRRHIQVQLPEKTMENSDVYNAGYENIAKLSQERIKRAGKKIRDDFSNKIAERSTPVDTGFRVYKLAPSNFVQWDENRAKDDIQQSVLDFAANKKPDAAPEFLLTEIILQARMPLSANIERRNLQNGGWVYVVDRGNLIAYVADEQITEAQANEIADLAPAKLIVLDSAFNGNNALKINIMNICKEKFIKEFKTI